MACGIGRRCSFAFLTLRCLTQDASWVGRFALLSQGITVLRLVAIFHQSHRKRLSERPPTMRLGNRMNESPPTQSSQTRLIQKYSIKAVLTPYILSVLGDRAEMAHSIEGQDSDAGSRAVRGSQTRARYPQDPQWKGNLSCDPSAARVNQTMTMPGAVRLIGAAVDRGHRSLWQEHVFVGGDGDDVGVVAVNDLHGRSVSSASRNADIIQSRQFQRVTARG